jgi:hypothetical protein|tara:strand:- start:393 stop:578 length:186 start_codon:yes stop_codon:yes gene_type:complete
MNNSLLNILTKQADRMMTKAGVVDYKAMEALAAFHGTNLEEREAVLWEIGSSYPCKVGEPV